MFTKNERRAARPNAEPRDCVFCLANDQKTVPPDIQPFGIISAPGQKGSKTPPPQPGRAGNRQPATPTPTSDVRRPTPDARRPAIGTRRGMFRTRRMDSGRMSTCGKMWSRTDLHERFSWQYLWRMESISRFRMACRRKGVCANRAGRVRRSHRSCSTSIVMMN
jgi:hypothetical protein